MFEKEEILFQDTSIVVKFPGPRSVLSTSWLNGGYREDLTAVFNHQISLDACEACHSGSSIRDYLKNMASSLSLDPATASGLVTRADMKNAVLVTESFRDLIITAIVTAGVDKNGIRAGDPASYYEEGGKFETVGGTINIILLINAGLPEYAMNRAMITVTEAKTAVLQELIAPSTCSTGVATGSGTDMVCIISNPGSDKCLTDAGPHSKLGELMGNAVMQATRAALECETGLSSQSQCNVLARLSRFGITKNDLWNNVPDGTHVGKYEAIPKEDFFRGLDEEARDPELVARTAAVIHLLDETTWDMLPEAVANKVACEIIRQGMCVRSLTRDEERSRESVLSFLCESICTRVMHRNNPDTKYL